MPAMVRDFLRRGLVSAGRAGPGGAEVELRPAAAVDEAASGIRRGGSWTEKSGDEWLLRDLRCECGGDDELGRWWREHK